MSEARRILRHCIHRPWMNIYCRILRHGEELRCIYEIRDQSIKGARSYFEERSLERAPFENIGAEAGARTRARSFVQMSIIKIIESIHKWDRQNSFALSGVRINRSEIN